MGPEYWQIDIVPGAEFILQDVDEMQRGLLQSIAGLLRAPPSTEWAFVLDILPLLAAAENGLCGTWRARFQLAGQLADIGGLCGAPDFAEVIVPALLDPCRDPVAAVWKAAASQVGPILARVGGFHQTSRGGASVPTSAGGDLAAVTDASRALMNLALPLEADVCRYLYAHGRARPVRSLSLRVRSDAPGAG